MTMLALLELFAVVVWCFAGLHYMAALLKTTEEQSINIISI
jgi:hypothetical protein